MESKKIYGTFLFRTEDRRQSMRKDNAPPVTKGNNNDNARLAQLEFSSIRTYEVHINTKLITFSQ